MKGLWLYDPFCVKAPAGDLSQRTCHSLIRKPGVEKEERKKVKVATALLLSNSLSEHTLSHTVYLCALIYTLLLSPLQTVDHA